MNINDLNLNKNQISAAVHKDGPMIVVAGPGSGKTTVITYRIKNLIETYNINPSEILVITFAKAASAEMKSRFENLEHGKTFNVKFATFHSLFYTVIRGYYNFGIDNVLKEEEKLNVIKGIVDHLNFQVYDKRNFAQDLGNEISLVKNEIIDVQFHNPMDVSTELFCKIFNMYEEWKAENNKIDFDDMLSKCYNLLKENDEVLESLRNRYKYIMIDEFQDINRIQYETIKLIANSRNNIFVVGDDDQSIYRFRGSRPEFLLNFQYDYAETNIVHLETNYRSTNEIIDISSQVINQNKVRFNKQIVGTNISGEKPCFLYFKNSSSEALNICKKINKLKNSMDLSEVAVIYRTNSQALAFIEFLLSYQIPFQLKDITPGVYDSWIFKDIEAYLKLALNRDEPYCGERIINKPNRYISKKVMGVAKTRNQPFLSSLMEVGVLSSWQVERIEEFNFYLNALKNRKLFDAIKYLRQAVGYNDYIKSYADYNKINPKGIFDTLDQIQEQSKEFTTLQEYLDHVKTVRDAVNEKNKNRQSFETQSNAVVLSTMHGVKGLEYDTVFIAGVVEGYLPYEKSSTKVELEEECRLLYVAMTRAKRKLFISILENRLGLETEPSRFLKIIEKNKFLEEVYDE